MASHHTTTPVSPSASAEEVERKIDELYRQAGSDAGPYSPAGHTAAREEPARQRGRVAALLDDMARRTDMLGRAREMLQAIAGSPARTEPAAPDATALLPETPQGYFDQAQLMSRLIARQKSLVTHSSAQRSARSVRAASPATGTRRREAAAGSASPGSSSSGPSSSGQGAEAPTGQPAGAQRGIRAAKAAVQHKLADARALLADAAAAPERAEAEAPAVESAEGGAVQGPQGEAQKAKALAFARAQIGKPYVWGAAGPGSYDSSGLAQAAWKAAGVALPRAVHDQARAGRRVPLSEALHGDLVFFHGEAGHVGVYAGDGMMIHAPRPGAHVREESIFYEGAAAILGVVRPA
ncbi:C40 family peptidase [Streptomyces sp. NRRL S-813]|uniref:C40 family peptidase n=1 Tax=Streptomyces sp. NRRL S-813 TaxID=1463919 RepID=UPI0004C13CC2|nr:C40 family peptidase [Streptomyces sp. NRRL S-813]